MCEHDIEESEHFLLNYPLYLIQRQEMLQNLTELNTANVNLEIMLWGSTVYDFRISQSIFKAIREFTSACVRL